MTSTQKVARKKISKAALEKFLTHAFGLEQFRPGQREVMASILEGHHTLAIMPTGAGKSLCYQLPALYQEGTTIVVPPLISLMKDQADGLNDVGIDALQMNSFLSSKDLAVAMENIKKSESEIVFTTPEKLLNLDFIAALKKNLIDFFVIDEAHCISQWGHDFRPAFLHIGDAIKSLGSPPVLALTATATPRVIDDIIKQLDVKDMRVFNTGIYRSNLCFTAIQTTNIEEKRDHLLRLVKEQNQLGIVYTSTVKAASELFAYLLEAGINATIYHGRLSAQERKQNQNDFMEGKYQVIIATNAFGLGIDNPHIRFVIHYQIPATLEAYYQEAGRAGRDGEPANCILLYDNKDKAIQNFFLAHRYPMADDLKHIYDALCRLHQADKQLTIDVLKEETENFPSTKMQVILKLLKDAKVLKKTRQRSYKLLNESLKPLEFETLVNEYQKKAQYDQDKLEQVISYVHSASCRWKFLLNYFEEKSDLEKCNTCDNCVNPPERFLTEVKQTETNDSIFITSKLSLPDIGELVTVPKYGAGKVISADAEKITITFPDEQTKTFLRSYVTANAEEPAL